MYAFNNFLRVETSKEEKKNLLKDARELQANCRDGAANASFVIYKTTSLEYAPKKEAKSRGFSGIAIVVVGPCKGKIELSVSTALPEDVVVLIERKSASETRYELKLLGPSNAASLKITDCKTTVTVHTVPCRLPELIELLIEQTTPPPSPPLQATALARVPGHTAPNSRPKIQRPVHGNHKPANRWALALVCVTVAAALILVLAHLCVKSEQHLSSAARYDPVNRERIERYEEVIAIVARGEAVPMELLPGSTRRDVVRFVAGLYNQAIHDVAAIALQPGMQDIRRSLAERMRTASVIKSLEVDDELDVLPPPAVVKELRYVGEALLDDLDRLTKLAAAVVVPMHVGQHVQDVYARHAHIKEFCAWLSQCWEGACKHHLSE